MRSILTVLVMFFVLGDGVLARGVLARGVLAREVLAREVEARGVEVGDVKALREAWAAAGPGDVIRVAPGEYERAWLAGGGGSVESPVIIQAADPQRRPTFVGGQSEGMHLSGVSHVELRDLIITSDNSNALNIDDAGRRDTPARGVVLRGLTLHGAAKAPGNVDGIKLSGLADFRIVDCHVLGWGGQGCGVDMVGCRDGVIEHSTFDGRGNGDRGLQTKGNSAHITVRGCAFLNYVERGVNLGGNTGADYFRPRLSPQWDGFEARDITVEHCTFHGGKTPVAFASSTRCAFQNNLVAYPDKWAFRLLRENRMEGSRPTQQATFAHNLIVWKGKALSPAANVGPGVEVESLHIADNWWYRTDRPESSRPTLPVTEIRGHAGRDPQLTVDKDHPPTVGTAAEAWLKQE